ncbi:MAG: hypothetical protein JRH15_17810 [Deltaproteobacteria bacterium]|nr:hypothetical protein [Deltaproteobacteria bacterium]
MARFLKFSTVIMVAVMLMTAPLGSAAMAGSETDSEKASAEKMAVDLLVMRPLGFGSTILGTALYAVSLPFSLLGGNTKQVWETAVEKPAEFTFKRPLGEF